MERSSHIAAPPGLMFPSDGGWLVQYVVPKGFLISFCFQKYWLFPEVLHFWGASFHVRCTSVHMLQPVAVAVKHSILYEYEL